jgi:hypothetical protein
MEIQQLSDVIIANKLLATKYRTPSITGYNRMEPRPRSEDFERSLRAEIRDPLWMITRQWQMGELEAEDTGSAIDARLLTHNIKLDCISFDHQNGEAFTDDIPMEAFVEREAISFQDGDYATTYGLRVKMGQYFLKLHSPALRAKYIGKYRDLYSVMKNREADFKGQPDGLNFYIASRANGIDGAWLYADVIAGTLASKVNYDLADLADTDKVQTLFKAWFTRQYSQPSGSENPWHSQTLDYQFSTAASHETGRQQVLEASHYHNGRLDWYSFDENPRSRGIHVDEAIGVKNKEEIISFLPAPAEFKGMPNPRFWEMEERQTDFGKINAKTTDHLLLVFAEFGLVYGNDWSVIPYPMPVNTICEVKGLVVTDVFGDRTLIRAANEGDENIWQRWSMFNLSNKDSIGLYNRQFYLPSTLVQTLQSDPIEQVNFVRDEMVNMAWGVEDIIPGATGQGINGHEAADQTGVLPPPIVSSPASIRYLLGTTVPENWIPFLPVQKPNSVQDMHFQRAVMPRLGDPPGDVVKPKGKLLTEVPAPYYINEEEIPYSGSIVTRAFQRARWYNGSTYLWIGRHRENGRGQGDSKLRFDQIEALKKN